MCDLECSFYHSSRKYGEAKKIGWQFQLQQLLPLGVPANHSRVSESSFIDIIPECEFFDLLAFLLSQQEQK
jgi:hypothetical protein